MTVIAVPAPRSVGLTHPVTEGFQALLEATPDAIVGVLPDGRIAVMNEQAEALFGYTREELIGQQLEILVPEGTRTLHPPHRAEYLASPRQRPMGGLQQADPTLRD